MIRRPTGYTQTDRPIPYTPRCRSTTSTVAAAGAATSSALAPHNTEISFFIVIPPFERARQSKAKRHLPEPANDKIPLPPCRSPISMTQWLGRSEEHTSELQSLMPISYAVFRLKKKQY